jgi:hypothetical protein
MPEIRHQSTTHLLQFFEYEHLPQALQDVSAPCADLAEEMTASLLDGPELTAGLRKLLEAKDCFVRAAVSEMRDEAAAAEPSTEEKG